LNRSPWYITVPPAIDYGGLYRRPHLCEVITATEGIDGRTEAHVG